MAASALFLWHPYVVCDFEVGLFCDGEKGEGGVLDAEFHFHVGEGHAVDAVGVVVVLRTRVVGEDVEERGAELFWHLGEDGIVVLHR